VERADRAAKKSEVPNSKAAAIANVSATLIVSRRYRATRQGDTTGRHDRAH